MHNLFVETDQMISQVGGVRYRAKVAISAYLKHSPLFFRGRYTLVRGKCLNGIQEVSGSILLTSAKGYVKRLVFVREQAFSLFYDEIDISLPFRGGRTKSWTPQKGANKMYTKEQEISDHSSVIQ